MVHADPEQRGAAIWALPGNLRTTAGQDLRIARALAHPRHWLRGPRIASGLLGLERVLEGIEHRLLRPPWLPGPA